MSTVYKIPHDKLVCVRFLCLSLLCFTWSWGKSGRKGAKNLKNFKSKTQGTRKTRDGQQAGPGHDFLSTRKRILKRETSSFLAWGKKELCAGYSCKANEEKVLAAHPSNLLEVRSVPLEVREGPVEVPGEADVQQGIVLHLAGQHDALPHGDIHVGRCQGDPGWLCREHKDWWLGFSALLSFACHRYPPTILGCDQWQPLPVMQLGWECCLTPRAGALCPCTSQQELLDAGKVNLSLLGAANPLHKAASTGRNCHSRALSNPTRAPEQEAAAATGQVKSWE